MNMNIKCKSLKKKGYEKMVEIFRHDLTLMNHELWDCGYTHAIITVFGFGCLLVDHHPQANSWRLCSRLFSYALGCYADRLL